MPLVSSKELLSYAKENNIAVGAFSVGNLEMIAGVIAGAEELNNPVILQISQSFVQNINVAVLGNAMINSAKLAKVPVAVHFDGGLKFDTLQKALDMGFTSVMFDGSNMPMGDNIQAIKQLKKTADLYGASVEGKLGINKDAISSDEEIPCTSPDEAKLFCDETSVDALSVVVGNNYEDTSVMPQIRYEILDDIGKMIDTPICLQCGPFITPEMIQQSIMLGVRKIGVNMESLQSAADGAFSYCKPKENADFFELIESQKESVYENTKKYIKIFNMQSDILNQ